MALTHGSCELCKRRNQTLNTMYGATLPRESYERALLLYQRQLDGCQGKKAKSRIPLPDIFPRDRQCCADCFEARRGSRRPTRLAAYMDDGFEAVEAADEVA